MPGPASRRTAVFAALGILYAFWGSSYLANQVCLRTVSPLILMSLRFIAAGGILLILGLISRPASLKNLPMAFAFTTGILLVGSNTFVAIAQDYMPSSAVATMVGTVPLWALFFSAYAEKRFKFRELRPVALGLLGIVTLTFGWNADYPLLPTLSLLAATMVWAATSVRIAKSRLPMTCLSLGTQMFSGGIAVLAVALARGKTITGFSSSHTVDAFSFLVLGPSILAYAAYNYLLKATKTSLATSYAFACPLVATFLGIHFLKERPGLHQYIALGLILGGLTELLLARENQSRQAERAILVNKDSLAA